MKKIALSLSSIAAVCLLAVGATTAFWSDSETLTGNTFATGSVSLGDTAGFPVNFQGLYPGKVDSSGVLTVNYSGSVTADLWYGLKFTPGHDSLQNVLKIQIEKVVWNGTGWVNDGWVYGDWTPVTNPFAQWTKLADNVNGGQATYFRLWVQMDASAGNEYMNKTAVNDIVIYAVQDGGTAPTTIPCVGVPDDPALHVYCGLPL